MADNKLEEILALQQLLADASEFEKQQAKEDLEELQGKTKKITSKSNDTSKSLRQAADKLDKVWKDCKIAHAAGTSVAIVSGVLTVTGGVLTILTLGAAAPVLFTGLGVGLTGAGINIGTSITEACINSEEVKKAEKDLQETHDCINDRKNTVQMWLDKKEKARLLYMFCFAVKTLELSDPVIKFLQQILTQVTGIPTGIVQLALRLPEEVAQCYTAGHAGVQAAGQASIQVAGQAGAKAAAKAGTQGAGQAGTQASAQAGTQGAGQAGTQASAQAGAQGAAQAGAQGAGQAGANAASKAGTQAAGRAGAQGAGDAAESGAKAGANAGSKIAGGLIIGVSAASLIWDVIDLGFTIRDIVQNKGSNAASYLREKADELDKIY